MRLTVAAIVFNGMFVAGVGAPVVSAQSPAFEVASVKVNHSGSGATRSPYLSKGRLGAENTTMRQILMVAWGLSFAQINGPNWIDDDRFDIEAKAPDGVPDTDVQPMLQALLKERFALEAHLEKKEMAVYNLVVSKGGLKIKPFDPEHPMMQPPRMPGAWGMTIGRFSMPELARVLASSAERPVVDKTGVEGKYSLVLQYGKPGALPTSDGAPDIFGAVQEQLGLKLEPAKGSVSILVVDHAERVPTEN